MKLIVWFCALMLSILTLIAIAFGFGFIVKLLLNPVLIHFKLLPVSTTLCACVIGLIMVFRLLFISKKK